MDERIRFKRTALLAGLFGFLLVFAAQSAKRGGDSQFTCGHRLLHHIYHMLSWGV